MKIQDFSRRCDEDSRVFDLFAILCAALGHDIGHRGMNNGFEVAPAVGLRHEYSVSGVLSHDSVIYVVDRY